MQPLVSVIVPCYNQAQYLPETLDSVMNQVYLNWECIIVDDGSPDNTAAVANEYCLRDPRFRYLHKSNGGLSSARNAGIEIAEGEYILPLDSDDLIAPEYVGCACEVLSNNARIGLVYCRAKLFEKADREWHLEDYSLDKMLGANQIFCTAMYRKSDYDQTSGYNVNMKYGFEDWDFWLSLLELGVGVHRIDEVMFYYRVRVNSMARSMDTERLDIARRQIWENHRQLYAENFLNPRYTYEYTSIITSKEYRLGKLLLKPVRKLLGLIK